MGGEIVALRKALEVGKEREGGGPAAQYQWSEVMGVFLLLVRG